MFPRSRSLHLPWLLHPLLEKVQVLVSDIPAPDHILVRTAGGVWREEIHSACLQKTYATDNASAELQTLPAVPGVSQVMHTSTYWAAVHRLPISPVGTVVAVSADILLAAEPTQPFLPLRRHKLPTLAGAQSHNRQYNRREGSRQGEVEPHFPADKYILLLCYGARNPFRHISPSRHWNEG